MENAKEINVMFEIIPLLYGSLGLQQYLDVDLKPKDIDILIPEIFLKEKWEVFKQYLESKGYILIDLHEHTFEKSGIEYSYAGVENLKEFVNISMEEIKSVNNGSINYRILSLQQYLLVYQKSRQDGYRINKKEKKDNEKIELIKQYL